MSLLNISVEWQDEARTILIITYEKGWTWVDFRDADVSIGAMMSIVDHKVSMILDARKAIIPKGFSFNFPELTEKANGLNHPNAEYIVIVGMKPYLRALYQLFSSIFKEYSKTTFMVSTLSEAEALIKEKRARVQE